jgi:xylulokinase
LGGLKKVIKTILGKTEINSEQIRAVSVDSQGETLICLDKDGEPLLKAILWLDNRSFKETEEIGCEFDLKDVINATRQPQVAATWPATKIFLIRKNENNI